LGVAGLGLLFFLGRGAVNWSVQWLQQHEKPQLKYAAASGNYTIQVAAIKDSARAALTAGKLRRAGYYAYVLPPRTNSRYYRIRLGRFQGKTPADTLARHLVQKGVIREFYVAPWDSTRPVAP
jgi:cell division septation protein DedD